MLVLVQAAYGVQPRTEWIAEYHGGHAGVQAASNIVFSNGALDPWSAGGVKESSGSVKAVLIEEGAHHLDLMVCAQHTTHISISGPRLKDTPVRF